MFRARSTGLSRLAALAVLVAGLGACRPVDQDRPLPPSIDVRQARTTRATWLLTGAAEPGARIVVTRLPLLAATALPDVHASPSDARFSVEVPLEPHIPNTFLVSAVDDAGLGSDPTEVKVEQVDAAPASVTLEVSDTAPRIGSDGKAQLKARAHLAMDDGSSAEGRAILFRVEGLPGAPIEVTGRADARGDATVTIRGLTGAGAATVTATVPGTELASEDVPFRVRPGDAATAELALSATTPTGLVSGADVTVPAGVQVSARVTAKDAAGNAIPAAFTLESNPPALVAGGIALFTKAGRYTLTATLDGGPGQAPATATASVTVTSVAVTPAAPVLVATFPARVTSGVSNPFTLRIVDGAGRETEPPTAAITLSDSKGTFANSTKTLTFQTAGRQTALFKVDTADGQHLTAEVVTVVRTGPVATLEALLAGTAAPLASPRAAGPRDTLALTVNAKDAAGNAISDPPLAFDADPGLDLFGTTLTAPAAAGTYALVVTSPGSAAKAVAVVSVAAQPPANVTVRCPSEATAGVPIVCTSSVTDAAGLAVTAPVTWSVVPSTAGNAANGRVTLTAAGAATVRATVNALSASAAVQVTPAPASQLQLSVTPSTLAAGATAQVTTTVTDAFGNTVARPVTLTTDAPGAIVGGGTLSNLAKTGAFRVVARLAATAGEPALEAVQPITVTAQSPGRVAVTLSSAKTIAGQPVKVTFTALDAFGNAISNPTLGGVTVDGAAPDGLKTVFTAATGDLVVWTPGPHRIGVSVGSASGNALLTVTPAADVLAPDVAVGLDKLAPNVPAPQFYKPGQTVQVTVRARDDQGLAGVRIRVSSSDFGTLLDKQVPVEPPAAEFERVFPVVLPTSRVGSFTVTASASDRANHGADATPVSATVDFHFDRFTLGGPAASASARSVSVDPALGAPTSVAYANGTPYATATLGSATAPAALAPGAGGLVQQAFPYPANVTDVNALAASSAGNLYFDANQDTGRADDEMIFRLAPGVPAPQAYTVPPLISGAPDVRLTGLAIDSRSTSGKVYAAQAIVNGTSTNYGRLSSMPLKDGASAYTVNVSLSGGSREVFTGSLTDLKPIALCVPDVSNPTELYFTADRVATPRLVGLYKVALTGGNVGTGALTATTLFEEAKDASGGAVVTYGPCVHHPGSGAVLFASSVQTPGGAPAGRILGCASTGCTVSTLQTVLQPTGSATLGVVGGLARGNKALFATETTAGRIFRLDDVF